MDLCELSRLYGMMRWVLKGKSVFEISDDGAIESNSNSTLWTVCIIRFDIQRVRCVLSVYFLRISGECQS